MKPGRNDLCPCGSGKKYKRCCMNSQSKQTAQIADELEQIVAMNPNLSLDELELVMQRKMDLRNNQSLDEFCGLSPNQMSNWLSGSFTQLQWVNFVTPEDLCQSPVMRYLGLIIDEAIEGGGSFKATAKGNLPAKLAKSASALLPGFAISAFDINPSISEFAGSNEDKFNALHYTRILAEIAGIIYRRSGRFHIKKAALAQYEKQGLAVFFLPMLEAAVTRYNWEYFDIIEHDVDLRLFWLFMVWRLQSHGSIDQLNDEMITAFPDLLRQLPGDNYCSPEQQLSMLIEIRFALRFLQYWGFVTVDPRRYDGQKTLPRVANIQPLMTSTFDFSALA
ncbi:MAG: SEC-C domain-containing protein [Shewanella sp.]|nr:SEC-C domain-containing protein [Shewanella sp.]